MQRDGSLGMAPGDGSQVSWQIAWRYERQDCLRNLPQVFA